MRSQVPPSERFGRQNAEREQQRRDLDDALRIDGSQFVRLYEKMQALIANLQTTVTNLVNALTYTRAQIDSKIASPGTISPVDVNASGRGTFPAGVTSVGAYNELLSGSGGTIRALWIHPDGRLGYLPSDEALKLGMRPATFTVEQVLSLRAVLFQYQARVPFSQQIQPEYLGAMAQEVEAAGFPWLVDRDGNGNAIGVHHAFGWLVTLEGLRGLYDRVLEQDARISRLEAALGLQ